MRERLVNWLAGCNAVRTRPAGVRWSILPTWPWSRQAQWLVRGAKTRSTVKANNLPQGALPPLPPDGLDTLPEKTYPTVLQQHLNNVRKFKDCIVLTRVGDFYEMYFDQVEQYAPLVNLKKAKRATALGSVPMAGFQHTQLDRYLKMFVQDLGKQVAISEQIRLPDSERNARHGGMLFDRKVTRVVTPGTLIDESFMDQLENNYLLAIHFSANKVHLTSNAPIAVSTEQYAQTGEVGLSWVDLSSGDFFTQQSDLAALPSLVAKLNPREMVLDSAIAAEEYEQLRSMLGEGIVTVQYHRPTGVFSTIDDWRSMLERAVPSHQQTEFSDAEISAGNLVLEYIRGKLQDRRLMLQPPVRLSGSESMAIDRQSLRNLEIRCTLRDGNFRGSLLHAMRRTVTKSGARLLSQRLVAPSLSLAIINNRLDLVQELLYSEDLRETILAALRRTSDTTRLLQKFSVGKGDADDLLGLAKTIDVMQELLDAIHGHVISQQDSFEVTADQPDAADLTFLWDLLNRIDLAAPIKLAQNIQHAIDEEGLYQIHLSEDAGALEAGGIVEEVEAADASGGDIPKISRRLAKTQVSPSSSKPEDSRPEDIWIMRSSASPTLARAHKDLRKLLQARQELSDRLRHELGADSLTLRWSAQLGHFCHIKGRDARGTLSALDGARVIGATKSTRSFYFADWTQLGVNIDEAKLRIRAEEERVFDKLRGEVLENLMRLRRNATVLDELDVACSSATIATERNLIRPILREAGYHKVIGGRHPTVNISLKDEGRSFTANDCLVGDNERIYLITGPNMAGKSTYLRQNALITILAQTGCFVPAEHAEIGLVDKMFSRVGSADNLYQDQSTFMVEMLEAAEILKQATSRSFVIMDEIGRGTTPEDGVAVGYACLHHLQYINKCRALFATHFHSLADMTQDFESLACYCTDVAERRDGSWTYDHQLRRGVNRNSHALKVARLAGLPEEAISVASQVLAGMQNDLKDSRDGTGMLSRYAKASSLTAAG